MSVCGGTDAQNMKMETEMIQKGRKNRGAVRMGG